LTIRTAAGDEKFMRHVSVGVGRCVIWTDAQCAFKTGHTIDRVY